MTATHSRGAINTGILCFGLLLGLAGFANGNNEPNTTLPPRHDAGQFQYTGALCGHITDAQTGQPVTDATVRLQNECTGPTDVNGFYLIENLPADSNYTISIDSNEYINPIDYQLTPSVNIQKDTQSVKDFKLDRAGAIQIQVVDEVNQPIEGAEVSIRRLDNQVSVNYRQGGVPKYFPPTNRDGVTLLGGLIQSKMEYLIIASHSKNIETANRDVKEPDYAPGTLIATLNSTEFIETGRIVLRKGIDVKGRAVYEDGTPARNLTICASHAYRYGNMKQHIGHGSFNIDENGNFTLTQIVPDSYSIVVSKQSLPFIVTDMQIDLPLSDNGELVVKIPRETSQQFVSIRGKFNFTNGIPPIVEISSSPEKGGQGGYAKWQKREGDAYDMNFVIDHLLPGKQSLTFASPYIKQKNIDNIDAPSKNLEVELETFKVFSITGTVVDSRTGEPVQPFKVCIKRIKSFSEIQPSQPEASWEKFAGIPTSQPNMSWQTIKSEEGKFNVEAIGEGIYKIQIATDGFAWTESDEIDTAHNVPVVINLSKGGRIKGIVVNDAGQPINGAKIVPMSKIIPTYNGDTISEQDSAITVNGFFELKNITAGMESIKAVHPDYPSLVIDNIEVKEGQTTEGIKIVLGKNAAIEGYVYDSAGKPQAGTTIVFRDAPFSTGSPGEKEPLATATTDINGYYRANGLHEQACYVERPQIYNGNGVARRAIVPSAGKITRLDFGGKPVVTGRVIMDGKPLANYLLTLSVPKQPQSVVFLNYTKTGPNGEFTFGGVPKGKWSIWCWDPEVRRSRIFTFATIETSGQDIDTGVIPKKFSTLNVFVEYEQAGANWDTTYACLDNEGFSLASPVAILNKPVSSNEPFSTGNILPGRYRLRVGYGSMTVQQTIDINEDNVNVTVQIPNKGTASLKGRFITNSKDSQALWMDGKEIVCYIEPNTNGNYELNHLPAGRYHLSSDYSVNSETLLDIDLAEGEPKTIDLDIINMSKNRNGSLHVFILDESGIPLATGNIYLEGNKTKIAPVHFNFSAPSFRFEAEQGIYNAHVKFDGFKETIKSVEVKKTDNGRFNTVFVRLEK